MFEDLSSFHAIAVTGPQRSGTQIASKMIANDTGMQHIHEHRIFLDSMYAFRAALGQGGVVQAPSLSRYVHLFASKRVLVVFMIRPVLEILASEERIGWQDFARQIELAKYGRTLAEGPIAKVKYEFWERQKSAIPKYMELRYHDLSEHPMWVPKAERLHFTVNQTEK